MNRVLDLKGRVQSKIIFHAKLALYLQTALRFSDRKVQGRQRNADKQVNRLFEEIIFNRYDMLFVFKFLRNIYCIFCLALSISKQKWKSIIKYTILLTRKIYFFCNDCQFQRIGTNRIREQYNIIRHDFYENIISLMVMFANWIPPL